MITVKVEGTVLTCRKVPAYTDPKTGEIRAAYSQVQVLADPEDPNELADLITFSVDDLEPWTRLVGNRISVDARVKGKEIRLYPVRGCLPRKVGP